MLRAVAFHGSRSHGPAISEINCENRADGAGLSCAPGRQQVSPRAAHSLADSPGESVGRLGFLRWVNLPLATWRGLLMTSLRLEAAGPSGMV